MRDSSRVDFERLRKLFNTQAQTTRNIMTISEIYMGTIYYDSKGFTKCDVTMANDF